MSKWTDFRDGIVDNMNDVATDAKNSLVASLADEGIDVLEDIANAFIEQLKAQATDENGWCALRDKFVLPLLINGVLWAVKLVIDKSTDVAQ